MANTRQTLESLLEELTNHPESQIEIFEKINDSFGEEKAVLVLDMSGFCRTVRRHSIIHVLSMIHQMRKALKPCVEAGNGQLIKAEADNLFCIFDTVADALQACRNIRECLDNNCFSLPQDCRLDVSIGIGFGHILNVENQDIFGEEVNLASKLGEDIALAGEVLLTENAFLELVESESFFQEKSTEISGISVTYHHFTFTN